MSTDDIYRIEELEDGRFSVYHYGVEDYPREPLVVGVSLKAATWICDNEPAEYGYYIAWIEDREDDDDVEAELRGLDCDDDASWKDVADEFDKLLEVDDEVDDDPLCTHKCDYHND